MVYFKFANAIKLLPVVVTREWVSICRCAENAGVSRLPLCRGGRRLRGEPALWVYGFCCCVRQCRNHIRRARAGLGSVPVCYTVVASPIAGHAAAAASLSPRAPVFGVDLGRC